MDRSLNDRAALTLAKNKANVDSQPSLTEAGNNFAASLYRNDNFVENMNVSKRQPQIVQSYATR